MPQMIANADGTFTLQPGTYLLSSISDDDGYCTAYHPGIDMEIYIEDASATGILENASNTGIDLLAIAIPADRLGVAERTLQILDYGILGGAGIIITPSELPESRDEAISQRSGYADDFAHITFDVPATVSLIDKTLNIGDIQVDLDRPGLFRFNNIRVDMAEDGLAEIFGYADAEFDEYGFFVNLEDNALAKLRALGTASAAKIADEIEDNLSVYLYYARDGEPVPFDLPLAA